MALPHLPEGGAGNTAQLTSVEGRGTHAPEMMCTISGEKWHGASLVRKWLLGAGPWNMARGSGIAAAQPEAEKSVVPRSPNR